MVHLIVALVALVALTGTVALIAEMLRLNAPKIVAALLPVRRRVHASGVEHVAIAKTKSSISAMRRERGCYSPPIRWAV